MEVETVGGKGGEHWGAVSQSLPPSSCLKPSATDVPTASFYLIPPQKKERRKKTRRGLTDLAVRRHIQFCLIKCEQETAEAHIFLDRVVGGKRLRVICQARQTLTASAGIESRSKVESWEGAATTAIQLSRFENTYEWKSVMRKKKGAVNFEAR